MSIRIHNGIRFETTQFQVVHEILWSIRPVVRAMQRAATLEFIGKRAALKLDREALGMRDLTTEEKTNDSSSPLMSASNELWERQKAIRLKGERDPEIDFDFTVWLLPFLGRFYGTVHSESRSCYDALMAQDGVEDFAFWDNTDRDENVSKRAWAERKAVWRAIFAKAGDYYEDLGYRFSIETQRSFPSLPEIRPFLPSIEERAARMAKDIVMGERYAVLCDLEKDRPPLDFSLVVQAAEWVNEDDGLEARRHKEAEIRPRLPELTDRIVAGY